jgi:hypothetical protein
MRMIDKGHDEIYLQAFALRVNQAAWGEDT